MKRPEINVDLLSIAKQSTIFGKIEISYNECIDLLAVDLLSSVIDVFFCPFHVDNNKQTRVHQVKQKNTDAHNVPSDNKQKCVTNKCFEFGNRDIHV